MYSVHCLSLKIKSVKFFVELNSGNWPLDGATIFPCQGSLGDPGNLCFCQQGNRKFCAFFKVHFNVYICIYRVCYLKLEKKMKR